MKIGVIGGSGFIGSHVVDKLIEADHEVTVFDIMSPHRKDVRHIFIDITDLSRSVVAMTGQYDAVYHLAAMADVNDVFRSPVEAGLVNIQAVANVLEAARRNRIGRVILASTIWLYTMADPEAEKVDEEAPLLLQRVNHVYTASKASAEFYCWAYQRLYDLPITILRYGIPYGPRARAGTVLANFVSRALRGEPLIINGTGRQSRNYLYVEDLATGNVAALHEAGCNQVYNLDGPRPVSLKELAELVCRVVREVPIEYRDAREGDYTGRVVSNEKAKRELGWTPQVDIEEGIRRYTDWYIRELKPGRFP